MDTFKIDYKIFLSVGIVSLGFLFSYLVFAQDSSFGAPPTEAEIASKGIVFPVAELGNCGDKTECKKYCEEASNISACIDFAKKHGLMNEAEAKKAENFAQSIKGGGGPGGCQSPRDCEAFCRNIDNMETCIAFADKQGIKDKHIDQGRKILNYIRSGGQMPGGCNSKESCESYCGDFSHAEECYNFSKKSGIAQEKAGGDRDDEDLPSPEQFKKFLELAKSGETPGACKSKQECESFCRDQAHFEECISFGEKMGFMSQEQAAMARKTGGKGPGGCSSPEACQSFCNDPANQEACFKFAEESGLIPKEELARAKEGFVRLRQGLEQAPPEVSECLKSAVGSNVLEDIQSGKLVPGPEIGGRVRECFMRHGEDTNPQKPFEDAPKEVKACLKDKLGDAFDKIERGEGYPTPEMADTFRVCFQENQLLQGGNFGMPQGEGFPPSQSGGMPRGAGPQPQMIQGFLRSAPPGVAECLKEKLGDDFEKISSGEAELKSDLSGKMRSCFESFRPPEQRFNRESGEFEKFENPQESGGEGFRNSSFGSGKISPAVPGVQNLPQVVDCVKNLVGAEQAEKFIRGEKPGVELEEKIHSCVDSFARQSKSGEQLPGVPPNVPGNYQQGVPGNFPGGYSQYPQAPGNLPGGYPKNFPDGAPQNRPENYPSGYPQQPYPQPQYQQQYSPPPTNYTAPPGGNLLEIFKPILRIVP